MQLKPDDAARLAGDLLNLETRHGQGEGREDSGLVGVPASDVATLRAGQMGSYRIMRLLGRGGMGEVYEAQQDSPRRRVALKIVRPHLISPEVRRRFEHEVRILGSLQHPGIAQIYEAGQLPADAGEIGHGATTPFFAMEYVEGEPLTGYAAEHKLAVRERLELFLKVCQAVEHAHQRGVIHRDLKPANILVTPPPPLPAPTPGGSKPGTAAADRLGQPKVLDFGVARATDADVTATSIHTEIGKLVGTLPYMSPEQAAGDPTDLDTRSDVYALGVVLYELLSGKLPYEIKGDAGARAAQALRVIKEVDPTPLSSIDRVFRGDLETIVGKALEKERERRYQSVGELASDIRRYLDDEPIVARRASSWYELKKFAKRNRRIVTLSSAGGLLLLSTSVVAVIYGYREARLRDSVQTFAQEALDKKTLAESEARKAGAARDFLLEIFESAQYTRSGKDAKIAEALQTAAGRVSSRFADDPESRVSLAITLGQTLAELGDLPSASQVVDRAIADAATAFGDDAQQTLDARHVMATILFKQGDTRGSLALARQVLAARRLLVEEQDVRLLDSMQAVVVALVELGELKEAEQVLNEACALAERFQPPMHKMSLSLRHDLGAVYVKQGRFAEAEKTLRAVLDDRRRANPPMKIEVASTAEALASLLLRTGKKEDAAKLQQEVIANAEAVFGEEHYFTLESYHMMAGILFELGRHEESLAILDKRIPVMVRVRGAGHKGTLNAMTLRSSVLWALARKDDAIQNATEIMNEAYKLDPPNLELRGLSSFALGSFLRRADRFEEARPYGETGYSQLREIFGPSHPRTTAALQSLIKIYEGLGDDAKAREYSELLEAAKK